MTSTPADLDKPPVIKEPVDEYADFEKLAEENAPNPDELKQLLDSFNTEYNKKEDMEINLNTNEKAYTFEEFDHVPYIGFGGVYEYPPKFKEYEVKPG